MSAQILFITGTNTAVGKTVFTSLLLSAARSAGIHALGVKPFCSGPRSDPEILAAVQQHELLIDQVNPFYFSEPITPLLAARKHQQRIPLQSIVAHLRSLTKKCDLLLVEGAGGLLSPLGEPKTRASSRPYSNLDLLSSLSSSVLLVAANKLGTINHTLLTIARLKRAQLNVRAIILSDTSRASAGPDPSTASNYHLLCELLPNVPMLHLPHVARASSVNGIHKAAQRQKAQLLALIPPFSDNRQR